MTHIEDLQGAALRELDSALARQRKAEAAVRAAAVKCHDVGVSIERIRAMGGVSRDKVYRWLRDASDSESSTDDTSTPKAPPKRANSRAKPTARN